MPVEDIIAKLEVHDIQMTIDGIQGDMDDLELRMGDYQLPPPYFPNPSPSPSVGPLLRAEEDVHEAMAPETEIKKEEDEDSDHALIGPPGAHQLPIIGEAVAVGGDVILNGDDVPTHRRTSIRIATIASNASKKAALQAMLGANRASALVSANNSRRRKTRKGPRGSQVSGFNSAGTASETDFDSTDNTDAFETDDPDADMREFDRVVRNSVRPVVLPSGQRQRQRQREDRLEGLHTHHANGLHHDSVGAGQLSVAEIEEVRARALEQDERRDERVRVRLVQDRVLAQTRGLTERAANAEELADADERMRMRAQVREQEQEQQVPVPVHEHAVAVGEEQQEQIEAQERIRERSNSVVRQPRRGTRQQENVGPHYNRFQAIQTRITALPEAVVDIAVADREVEICEKKTLGAKAKALQERMRRVNMELDVQSKKVRKASKNVRESRESLGVAFEKAHDRIRAKGGEGAEYNDKVEMSSDFDIPSDAESEGDDDDGDDDMDIDPDVARRANPVRTSRASRA